jgi:hypothetical protein
MYGPIMVSIKLNGHDQASRAKQFCTTIHDRSKIALDCMYVTHGSCMLHVRGTAGNAGSTGSTGMTDKRLKSILRSFGLREREEKSIRGRNVCRELCFPLSFSTTLINE